MSTIPIEAEYRDGVFHPSRPIYLAEGTRVEILVIARDPSSRLEPLTPAEVAARIAAMPMESGPGGFSGEDHDAILYGSDGAEGR